MIKIKKDKYKWEGNKRRRKRIDVREYGKLVLQSRIIERNADTILFIFRRTLEKGSSQSHPNNLTYFTFLFA